MNNLTRRELLIALGAAATFPLKGFSRTAMRIVPPSQRITIRAEPDFYMHSVGLVSYGEELVCSYRRSDEHIASMVELWDCRSQDGGRTWGDHRLISKSSWEQDKATWVAPQLSRLRGGELLLLVDKGQKKYKFDWPMLTDWQKPDRGMANYLFVSRDHGRTWDAPRKVDDVGGEPGYIVELSNGTLVYTRTDSKPTTAVKYPAKPWGPIYYKSTAVFSDDHGKTWTRTTPISDDPLYGDCEVGIAEYAPGKLIAISRVGDGGSQFGQPSRFIFSSDYGKTWEKPVLSPIYAHRPIVHKHSSGKLFVTFRNAWGTTGTCGYFFDPEERVDYQPNSFIWDESVCDLREEALTLNTREGTKGAAEFTLYPMEDDDSSAELEAELSVQQADANGCQISVGCWVRFLPGRVELANRPEAGFQIDANNFHRYRLVNRDKRIKIWADGRLKLDESIDGIFVRPVRFGNRPGAVQHAGYQSSRQNKRRPLSGTLYEANSSRSQWHSISVKIENRRDNSVTWRWTAKNGFPDQFRRDHLIRMEPNGSFAAGNSGYSGWAELPDKSIVVADYTSGDPPAPHPVLRAYRIPFEQI